MRNSQNKDDEDLFSDLVHHSVIADSDSVLVDAAGQLF